MYKLRYCPICRNRKSTKFADFVSPEFTQVNREFVRLNMPPIKIPGNKFIVVKCLACGLLYQNPRLQGADLKRFYDGFYKKLFTGRQIQYDTSVYKNINHYQELGRLSEIERFVKTGKILDLGAGPGHFLKVAREFGWQIFGQELSHHAAKIAKKQFDITLATCDITRLPFADNFFDVVTLHSVIEHIPQPRLVIRIAYRKLKPGGLLVMSIPNAASLNFYLARFFRLPYPELIFEHLTYYTQRALKLLLANKFRILELTSLYHFQPPQSPQRKGPSNSIIKLFTTEFKASRDKFFYLKQRLFFFQMRLLRPFLEYNRIGGKLKLGDVLYVFAKKI